MASKGALPDDFTLAASGPCEGRWKLKFQLDLLAGFNGIGGRNKHAATTDVFAVTEKGWTFAMQMDFLNDPWSTQVAAQIGDRAFRFLIHDDKLSNGFVLFIYYVNYVTFLRRCLCSFVDLKSFSCKLDYVRDFNMEFNMSGVREQKKQQTRRAIEKAAIDLFSCKGFDATSMEDIARIAGVGKATIYGYFPAKDDIFLHYCDDRLVTAFNQFKEQHSEEISFVEYLIAFFMIKFGTITENREFGRQLLREMLFPREATDKAREHDQRYFNILEGVFSVAEERGEIASNLDHFVLSGHFFSLYIGLLAGWYGGYFNSLKEVEKNMRSLFHQVCYGIVS